jgi:hypothetical protein
MTRMLGRFRSRGSCGRGACHYCQDGDETRRFKRAEQREVRSEIYEAMVTVREAREFGRALRAGKPVTFRNRYWKED